MARLPAPRAARLGHARAPRVGGRMIGCILLPFAAGYYLSYLFRTINALIAGDLVADLALSAADLGLVTSVYFLVFAAAQLPLGALLDAHGPRTIASALLLFASAGALVFAQAHALAFLLVGRALIGLGVSLALMAGLKAIVLWFPPERIAIANGALIMLGALGAVTATAPAEVIVQVIGWRGLFAGLAALSAASALFILMAVPDATGGNRRAPAAQEGVGAILRDGRFWRIAPLSSIGVGTSWSLQGLWAAPWLRDVTGLDRPAIVAHLAAMALAIAVSALFLGLVADRLRRRNVSMEALLAATLGLSMAAQLSLLLGLPLSSYLPWSLIAAAGAATVLSFAAVTGYFPREMSGRANAALNLLHIGAAFLLQSATGFVIALWPQAHEGYPPQAHRAALAAILLLEVAAFSWFAAPRRLSALRAAVGPRGRRAYRRAACIAPPPYVMHAPAAATGWPVAASASLLLSIVLAAALLTTVSRPAVAVRVLEIPSLGRDARAVLAPVAEPRGRAGARDTGLHEARPEVLPRGDATLPEQGGRP